MAHVESHLHCVGCDPAEGGQAEDGQAELVVGVLVCSHCPRRTLGRRTQDLK